MPSTIATSPGPCDSPAVVKRNAVIGAKAIGAEARDQPRAAARIASSGGSRPVQISQREGSLADEDLDPVDDGRARASAAASSSAVGPLAVDHVDDGLARGEAVGARAAAPRTGPRRAARPRSC